MNNSPENRKLAAACLPERHSKQCRDRWINYLAPGIKRGNRITEEDELIKKVWKKYESSGLVFRMFFLDELKMILRIESRHIFQNKTKKVSFQLISWMRSKHNKLTLTLVSSYLNIFTWT
jgi:hypothetical protein